MIMDEKLKIFLMDIQSRKLINRRSIQEDKEMDAKKG